MSEDRYEQDEPKEEEVEAHGFTPRASDEGDDSDDVEAHKKKSLTDEGDDFELHRRKA
jgi:hypothetical protein